PFASIRDLNLPTRAAEASSSSAALVTSMVSYLAISVHLLLDIRPFYKGKDTRKMLSGVVSSRHSNLLYQACPLLSRHVRGIFCAVSHTTAKLHPAAVAGQRDFFLLPQQPHSTAVFRHPGSVPTQEGRPPKNGARPFCD